MMAGTRGLWDEQDDGRLWTLLAEGLSSRQIGERMGRSKNSVLARVHRRGWRMARDPIGGPLRRTTSGKYASPPSPKSPPSPPVVVPVVPDTAPEPLPPAVAPTLPGDVQPAVFSPFTTCQYPYGARGDWQWCGKPVASLGQPYCVECRRRCWQVLPKWAA